MKIKHLLLIICLLCSSIISAQNSLFSKYADEDDVTIVNISKSMFNMIKNMDIPSGDVNINNIKNKIESLQIISSEKKELKEKMYADFKAMVDKDKSYEELMRVKEGKELITFNAKKKGDIINNLILLINEEDEFTAIEILGNFTVQDIQNIQKKIQ